MTDTADRGDKTATRIRALLAAVIFPMVLTAVPPEVLAGSGAVVMTAAGPVQGETERGVAVFRGIPYAEAPVGNLRFRPARAPKSWSHVRPVLDFAPACPQLVGNDMTENNNSVQSEDCLTVNVWTPKPDGKQRPVMVWIHGGSFIEGSARNTWYDGARLAARGDVVVVTMQYRLGALGFLDLTRIGGADYATSANLGLMDEVEALRWVRQNIGSFGGDPHNVTVFGESAGGISVALLLVMPAAEGLFDKAIIESGAPVFGQSEARSAVVTQSFMKIAGVHDIPGLQALSMQQMLDAQRNIFESGTADGSFALAADGSVLMGNGMALAQRGPTAHVPVLIGNNLDESQYFETVEDVGQSRKPLALFDKQLTETFGARAASLKETYLSRPNETYGSDVVAFTTDVVARMPTTRFAEALQGRQPVWVYLLNYRSTSTYKPFLSAHAMELPFVFGNLEDQDVITFTGRDPDRARLSAQMQDAWVAFARTGNPNAKGLPDWPRYDLQTRATMTFGKKTEVANDPLAERRKVWEGIPFDGQTPTPDQVAGFLFANGAHQ